eukprot:43251-Chlamydomonas_euryale.AAC.6
MVRVQDEGGDAGGAALERLGGGSTSAAVGGDSQKSAAQNASPFRSLVAWVRTGGRWQADPEGSRGVGAGRWPACLRCAARLVPRALL